LPLEDAMVLNSRRTFLGNLAGSLLTVGVGASLGGHTAWAFGRDLESFDALQFGDLEDLAGLLQVMKPSQMLETVTALLRDGESLDRITAAATLANARHFGGHDYTGYHCLMALMPAWQMSKQLPHRKAALPVLKVLHRQATQMRIVGSRKNEALKSELPRPARLERSAAVQQLRAAYVAMDVEAAEAAFAVLVQGDPREALNDLQVILHENLDVHRIVLAWRAWESTQLTGTEHARTLLRQSIRWCIDESKRRDASGRRASSLRDLLPELLEEHDLADGATGTRKLSDADLEASARRVFAATPEAAARHMAELLSKGFAPDDVGAALSIAANRLVLWDPGRAQADGAEKPKGSIHGASVGIHACDSARAWRDLAAASNPRNRVACLISGAYHTAGQSHRVGNAAVLDEQAAQDMSQRTDGNFLEALRESLQDGHQGRAVEATRQHLKNGGRAHDAFMVLADTSLDQSGALHAEKYYWTCWQEFAAARDAHRHDQLLALARTTASQVGAAAPGVDRARELLKG
tara:strand:+ start:6361 stop:7929 length:1569 start_codon:yes stop_codon:yes gene_type:complete